VNNCTLIRLKIYHLAILSATTYMFCSKLCVYIYAQLTILHQAD